MRLFWSGSIIVRQLVVLVAILLGCETVLLILLGTCVSWSVPLFEITATALLGVAVFIYAKLRFGPSLLASLAADKLPSGTIMCGALLFVAAVLLILPGPMTRCGRLSSVDSVDPADDRGGA